MAVRRARHQHDARGVAGLTSGVVRRRALGLVVRLRDRNAVLLGGPRAEVDHPAALGAERPAGVFRRPIDGLAAAGAGHDARHADLHRSEGRLKLPAKPIPARLFGFHISSSYSRSYSSWPCWAVSPRPEHHPQSFGELAGTIISGGADGRCDPSDRSVTPLAIKPATIAPLAILPASGVKLTCNPEYRLIPVSPITASH